MCAEMTRDYFYSVLTSIVAVSTSTPIARVFDHNDLLDD